MADGQGRSGRLHPLDSRPSLPPLQYIGFGGTGKQVRDLLHVDDLLELIESQLLDPERWDGLTVNVGGGQNCSLSLLETTQLCAEITGNSVVPQGCPDTRPGDMPLYLSDCARCLRSQIGGRVTRPN